jgi:hypothetical protein
MPSQSPETSSSITGILGGMPFCMTLAGGWIRTRDTLQYANMILMSRPA